MHRNRIVSCRALALVCAVLLQFAAIARAEFDAGSDVNWARFPAPGVVRQDAGTIEMTVVMTRPLDQFGNAYDFMLEMVPAQQTLKANSCLGVLIPINGHPTKGLNVVARSNEGAGVAHTATPGLVQGQPTRIAISWGKRLNLYVNGKEVASSGFRSPLATLPATFAVSRCDPWIVSEVRVSSAQLDAKDLAADPSKPMQAIADTTLLATEDLKKVITPTTAWHRDVKAAQVTPIWRFEGQLLREGDAAAYPLLLHNRSDAERRFTVKQKIVDQFKQLIAEPTEVVAVPAQPGFAETSLTLPLDKQGYYRITTTITDDANDTSLSYESAIAIIPKPETNVADGALSGYLGFHHLPQLSTLMRDKIGITRLRVWSHSNGFQWHSIEPEKGRFTWTNTDEMVRQARAADMEVIAVLGPPPPWAATPPVAEYVKRAPKYASQSGRTKPRSAQEFADYVYAVASRYKGQVKVWEIYNEVDYKHPGSPSSFSGTTADYFELLKAAHGAIRRADPDALVSASGFSLSASTDPDMPYDLLKMGAAQYIDIFNMHAYDVTKHVPKLKEALAAAGRSDLPLWMTEQMWHWVFNEERRLYLTPAVYFWFLEHGFERFHQFGQFEMMFNRQTNSPTRDLFVMGVAQNELRKAEKFGGVYRFDGEDELNVRCYLPRSDGRVLSVLGSEQGEHQFLVEGDVEEARDLFGRTVEVSRTPQGQAFTNTRLSYVISRQPLKFLKVERKGDAPLYFNGGFEEFRGDIGVGGLAAGIPTTWISRATRTDPQGKVGLTEEARTGEYALRADTSGKGAVYMFQDTPPLAAGTYRLSAWARRPAGSKAVPYMMVYDRATKTSHEQTHPEPSEAYTQFSITVTLDTPREQPIAIMVGAAGGAGAVLVDDVHFERVEQLRIDKAKAQYIDLSTVANQSLTDTRANDGAGGWADMGQHNLGTLPTGKQVMGGVPFSLLASPDDNARACLILGDAKRKQLPRQIAGIPVQQRLERIGFLHTAMYAEAPDDEVLGEYVVRYDDGSTQTVPIRQNRDLRDWYLAGRREGGLAPAYVHTDEMSHERGLFVTLWQNPHPQRPISTIDFQSKGNAVLVLLAATGESAAAE
ncbi:MAG TPA: endo-1,4-beta-xylanase [Tepidisphaeraceae bacterium]|jgi:hypothetical protein|nr:endo-1,4-beta-xylanase [Tepidisphaeraceae bacterium]